MEQQREKKEKEKTGEKENREGENWDLVKIGATLLVWGLFE